MLLFWSSDALLPLQAEDQLRYVYELLQVTAVMVADAARLLAQYGSIAITFFLLDLIG
jgi:hypothetical protein